MALLATPEAPPHWGTTFGGFGVDAMATGSRGRATADLVGASTASSVLSSTSTFSVTAASTFPATAAGTTVGVQGMPRVQSLLPASRKSVMALSHSLDYLLGADAVARCQVPCLHLVLGRHSTNEDGVQHVVVKGQACCTHLCGKILDPTHLLNRVAPRRYLQNMKASREVRFGPSYLRPVPRKLPGSKYICSVYLCRSYS